MNKSNNELMLLIQALAKNFTLTNVSSLNVDSDNVVLEILQHNQDLKTFISNVKNDRPPEAENIVHIRHFQSGEWQMQIKLLASLEVSLGTIENYLAGNTFLITQE